jgi:glycosyltransferase involved in cell wall biosynthesis
MPKVSVIIPLYNGKKFIKETLDTVFKQTYKDYELIIVNDGSTDNPESVLKPYLSKIKYITQKNSGCPAGAFNTGIAQSSGDYIAFLDQDDLWRKDKLQKQVEILDQKPEVGLVATNVIIFDDTSRKKIGTLWKKTKKILSQRQAQSKLLRTNFLINPSAIMVRREVFEKDEYCDERFKLADDYELWYRIAKKWDLALIEEPLTYYRHYSRSLSKNHYKMLKDLVLFYEMVSRDKKLAKKEHQFVIRKKALLNLRLANICLAANNFEEAREIYQKLKKEGRFTGKIKLIELLIKISPKMAGAIIRAKKVLSESGKAKFNLNLTI